MKKHKINQNVMRIKIVVLTKPCKAQIQIPHEQSPFYLSIYHFHHLFIINVNYEFIIFVAIAKIVAY